MNIHDIKNMINLISDMTKYLIEESGRDFNYVSEYQQAARNALSLEETMTCILKQKESEIN